MALGERLRREREARGITLEEIAKATKIGSRSLRALEEEDFGKLPGGIFNKGFVRAYAQYLGIDAEDAVADYLAAVGDPGDPALDAQRLKKLETTWNPSVPSDEAEPLRVPWAGIIILLVLVVGIFAAWHYRDRGLERLRQWLEDRSHSTQQSAVSPNPPNSAGAVIPVSITGNPAGSGSPVSAAVPPPAASVDSRKLETKQPLANSVSTAPEQRSGISNLPGFTVMVRVRRDCWVSAVADGREVLRGTLKEGREETIRAQQKILLTAGNAAGLEVQFNAGPASVLGATNQVRSVVFTSKGIQPQEAKPE